MEIERSLLSSVQEFSQSALTTRSRRPCAKRNSRKHTDRPSNRVVTHQKIMKELQKLEYRLYLHLKFDEIQKDYLTQTLVFFAGVELKKTPA